MLPCWAKMKTHWGHRGRGDIAIGIKQRGIDRDLLRISIVVVMFGLFASWSSLAFKGATLLDVTEQSLELIQEAKLSLL